MLRKQNIAVGRSYVNERAWIAREVIEEIDQCRVRYNAFDLKDGRLLPAVLQICRKSALALWADREANQDEISRIHPYEQKPRMEEVPSRDVNAAELELTRANLQQVVGHNNIHRW